MTDPRTRARQDRLRSNAAGPHGSGKRPEPTLADELAAEDDAHKAGNAHWGTTPGTDPSH